MTLPAASPGAASDDIEVARATRDALLHDAGVGTWRFDPDADVYFFSPELTASYGEGAARVVPRQLVEAMIHRDDLAAEAEVRNRICREGGSGRLELRMRNAEGWSYARVLLRSGRRLPSGRFEMYGLTEMITDLALARDEASAKSERLRIALDAATGGVFEIDVRGMTVECSPEFVAIVGRDMTFADMMTGWPRLHPEDAETLRAIGDRWGKPGFTTAEMRTGPGPDARWLRVHVDVTRDADDWPVRAVGLVLDIDHFKRQELALAAAQAAAEAATESKSSFLASMSHEIRTPMNGIVGVLHLLKNEQISEEGRKLLDEALACSGMLGQLINDVLDFSKIEAGKLEFAPEPTDVGAALEGVVDLLASQASDKGLYLRTEIQPDLGWALVDPVRLRQCLFNLIGNAVKFTLTGGVSVSMARAANGKLRFEVADTGIGVAPEARERLFGRFEQADTTTTRNFSGTGLGLAISRNLAQLMGGDIGFSSRENAGSIFWLELEAPPAAVPAAAVAQDGRALDGINILLVDDNATNRLVGAKILEALGASASVCGDGRSSVEATRDGAFDLILMDINMPGMDGIEATRLIRALPAPIGQVPILALTANVMAHQRDSYLEAGMDGVVAKPFSPASLATEIARVFAEMARAA